MRVFRVLIALAALDLSTKAGLRTDQLINLFLKKPSQWILIMGISVSIKKAIISAESGISTEEGSSRFNSPKVGRGCDPDQADRKTAMFITKA